MQIARRYLQWAFDSTALKSGKDSVARLEILIESADTLGDVFFN
jgi:hypothetical protein